MSEFFPRGIQPYVLGGVVLGVGVAMIYALTGRIAGLSSFLTAAQSWWSRRPVFRRAELREERAWKGVLVVALILGAALYTVLFAEPYVTTIQWWRLFLGGVIVGVGTRVARGCTSGHGICGLSALAAPSVAATLTFMAVAVVTARLVSMTGLTP